MKRVFLFVLLLPTLCLADLPNRDTYVYRLRESFRTGHLPQEKDLQLGQEWRCSEGFAYRTRRTPQTFKFTFSAGKVSGTYNSTLGKEFVFERDGSFVSRVTARHYQVRWYARVANDQSGNLIFEGMVFPKVGANFGTPALSDITGTANTYAICRTQLTQ